MASPASVPGRGGSTSPAMSAMGLANRSLFGIAILVIFLDFLCAALRTNVTYQGIVLALRATDLPLLVGLFVLFCGNFNYYMKAIEPRGETTWQVLLSLAGMLTMAALPVLVGLEGLMPFRYAFLALYSLQVIGKNLGLLRRAEGSLHRATFRRWTRRAVAQTSVLLLVAILYYGLMAPGARARVFGQMIQNTPLVFTSLFVPGVNLLFNVLFACGVVTKFVQHHHELDDLATFGERLLEGRSVRRVSGTPELED